MYSVTILLVVKNVQHYIFLISHAESNKLLAELDYSTVICRKCGQVNVDLCDSRFFPECIWRWYVSQG